jgi:hypothetical protein
MLKKGSSGWGFPSNGWKPINRQSTYNKIFFTGVQI